MTINRNVYLKLVEMGQAAKPAIKTVKDAKAELQGAYNLGVLAAVMAGSAQDFQACIEQLEDDIRHNRDGLAVKFGAPKREKPSENGEKYKIPSSVSTVKTVVLFAFAHGVSMGTTEKPETFGTIRKLNTAVREKLAHDAGTTLQGTALKVWQVQQACVAIRAKASEMSEDALGIAHKALLPWIAEAQAPAIPRPAVSTEAGPALATEASAPATSRKSARKAA